MRSFESDDRRTLWFTAGRFRRLSMNLYPYNSGHLMVVPYAHKGNFEDLTIDENQDIMSQVGLAKKSAANNF